MSAGIDYRTVDTVVATPQRGKGVWSLYFVALAIVTAYNARGQTASVTSYDSATARTDGNIVNQIVDAYNDWGQVATSWQAHDGPACLRQTPAGSPGR